MTDLAFSLLQALYLRCKNKNINVRKFPHIQSFGSNFKRTDNISKGKIKYMKTKNHKVVITGASRGIGKALADKFEENGNEVIRLSSKDADLTTSQGRKNLISTLIEKHSDMTVFINNAGIQVNGEFEKLSYEDYNKELEININAVVELSKGVLPILKDKKESALINVSSALVIQPKSDAPIYCGAKAFVRLFTKSLRYQLENTSIKVFDIVPPLVETDMTNGRGKGKIKPEALAKEF